jgi:hypothetical protein
VELRTGLLFIPRWWLWRSIVELYWLGKTDEFGEKHVPAPFCPQRIPHGLTRLRTRAFVLKCRGCYDRRRFCHNLTLETIQYTRQIASFLILVNYNYSKLQNTALSAEGKQQSFVIDVVFGPKHWKWQSSWQWCAMQRTCSSMNYLNDAVTQSTNKKIHYSSSAECGIEFCIGICF